MTNIDNKVTTVLVNFDNSRVGLKAIQSSLYRASYTNAVPLAKYEVVFPVKSRKGQWIKVAKWNFVFIPSKKANFHPCMQQFHFK